MDSYDLVIIRLAKFITLGQFSSICLTTIGFFYAMRGMFLNLRKQNYLYACLMI